MATLFVDKIDPQSGTSLEIGSSGDTISLPTGATMTVPSGALSGQNYPAFKALMTNAQAISANTSTVIQINNEVFDIGGYFDTSTYRYTPPAGKYCFIGNVGNGTVESYLAGTIFKNGAAIVETVTDASNGARVPVHVIDEANGTDYYELRTYIPTGSSILSANYRTFFSAFRLGS
tara:strand:- start:37 stop:564 length:528 start_codon:yes stop_codon:yes gene_type:complete